ncbi:hypothetical protein Poli38472_003551 [Pythium oligandrum]|uniref:Sodium/hydrogen exchanger n=1 Tax=Pythium oligandrum TaxID=41045 RepID=A0A8K1C730_PYTOL|nr:hypothetical protein Poli38472_003551 [Pythium oligandrum]|eukprot:TMW57626.1 hypothetical protein Poli38472_003551 [Pythium oligandrum]
MDVSPISESVGCTVSAIDRRASFEKTTDAMKNDLEVEKRWTGGELLVCAIVQLLLVHVAYRLDKRNGAPLISMSSWAILFGILCGFFLSFVSASRLHGAGLDPQILFFGLLPPIILEAGFNTQRKGFFNNFWAILLLAVFGTLIATFITGGILIWLGQNGWITQLTPAEAFLYGSLISAIDPVATLVVFKKCNAPSMLFNLVFGESVLNDAVAIVVFTLFQDFVSSGNSEVNFETGLSMACNFIWIGVGSVALSAVVCYTSAYFLRHSDPHLREHPTYEISIVLLSSYASYVAADLFGLSGLLAVFFSGVIIRHYHMYNISPSSAAAFEHLLSTLAFLAENFIYLYLGISVFSYTNAFRWDWMFVLANIVALLVARAFNTFPLCAIANWWRSPAEHIPWKYMVVIWFSGLRGAIAFALALNVQTSNSEHAAILKSSTLFTVLFTTVFFGMGTGPLLRILKLDNAIEEKPLWQAHGAESFAGEKMPLLSSSFHDHQSGHGVRNAWVALDEKYLKPLFGGKPRNQTESTTSRLSDSMEPGANGW